MICIVETSFNSELDENIMASKHKRTFRKPKNAEEEKQLLENAVPKSTRSVNKWAMKIFSEWQSTRVNKKASEEPSSCTNDTSQIQDLETDVLDMTAESLIFFFLFILFHFFFQAFDLFQKRVGLMVIYLITILYIKCYPH